MNVLLEAHFWTVGSCRGTGAIAECGLGWQRRTFPALAVALRHPAHGWTLYDTGYDPRYFELLRDWTHRPVQWVLPATLPPAQHLERRMADAGLHADDFRRVIVSHFHLDHIAGLHRLPRATLVFAEDAWRSVETLSGLRAAHVVYHPAAVDRAQVERGRMLRNEDARPWRGFPLTWDLFGDDSLRLVALPGHARGQLGAVFRRAPDGREIFLVSDACWTRGNLQGKPPGTLARFLMDDPAVFRETLGRLEKFAAAFPETLLAPSHCAETIAGLREDDATDAPPQDSSLGRVMNSGRIFGHYLAARRRFTAFANRAALKSWQIARMRSHLQFVARESPFYQAWFSDPERGPATKLGSWPIVDKRIVTSHLHEWLTEPVDLAAARETASGAMASRRFAQTLSGEVTVGLSSGTTGPAAMFFVSARERAAWAGLALSRILRTFPWRQQQRVAFFLRANSPLYETLGSRTVQFAYFDIQRPFAELLDDLQRLAPTMIVAPPGALRLLAAERVAGRLRASPGRIVAVAEVFDADDRAAVEAAFGVRAEEVYQASEGFLAATCPAGALHWNEDIVRIERDEIGGGRYYPVLTDFRRRLQPVVRYRLDDVVTDEPDDAPPCACGSVFRRIRRIEGRSDDALRLPRTDGSGTGTLFPDFVRLAVTNTAGNGLEDFRVRQTDPRIVEVSVRPALEAEERTRFVCLLENALAADCARAGLLAPVCRWMPWPEDAGDGRKRRRVVGLPENR